LPWRSSNRSREGATISDPPIEFQRPRRIVIVAGEASGDLHGANLVRAIRESSPRSEFCGIGGERMKEAGVEILFHSSEMAVVGLTEVLSRIRVVARAYWSLKSLLKSWDPDLLILIDYPDFNLLLARAAKKIGVPVLYYISPQVWAWRSGRVRKIAARVDRMAVILPFEREFYRARGVEVEYVGHPLLERVPDRPPREEILRSLGLDRNSPILGILPGSRREEVSRLLPVMIRAAEILSAHHPKLACLLPRASTIPLDQIRESTEKSPLPIRVLEDMDRVLAASDLVIVASGTATLETALMQIPMVVVYRLSPGTYWLGRKAAKVPYISLVNLIAGERIVPELIQDEATPERVAMESEALLGSGGGRERMVKRLAGLRESLGGGSASKRTAKIALELIAEREAEHGKDHPGRG
jgi:lipid-A-disaccharide synthase